MSLVINNNMMAANTARNLNAHYGRLATSTQRLSTGLRVNGAADDAAGLAIRELQRADIAALHQGARNANDAISMIQTADGAMGVIDEKLIRLKELAEQAATGTYDSTQRLMIESEYQAMASEITRIANATDFNGIHLLDGTLSSDTHNGSGMTSTGKMKIHFGTGNDSAEDYYYITIGSCTASSLGVGNQALDENGKLRDGGTVSTQEAAQKALNAITEAIISKDKIRAHLGAMQNRLENTITNLNVQAENLQAAESRISDVDVATEMTQFVRNQILTQSAVAMLGQANSLPQMAMQLIGG
ncbi:flagellin [uncultured Desulfovibrio sp.]|uniref:flagellin n=1 Tax=uncultured Desulfovibrio sp. TaxID=167968 RepID=UPI002805FAE7|nr:flagellin [uncultured Desulfovibrio sp.]